MSKPRTLHSVNAMRVLAEYWVVRHHCLEARGPAKFEVGPVGDDIMGFFFVMSGFVVMYRHEKTDFTSWESKRDFLVSRARQVYPVFLLNLGFKIPSQIFLLFGDKHCWVDCLCPILQVFMLDGWAGCGWFFPLSGIAWFMSCIMWLWLAFPFVKDSIVDRLFGQQCPWRKMLAINLVWALLFVFLWGFDLQTLAGVPILRCGEFLIGCGAALALHRDSPKCLAGNRFWLPFFCVLLVYLLEKTDHGLAWVCLRERLQHESCTLWQSGQPQFSGIEPPCITLAEKIPNKSALIFAATLYGLGRAELADDGTVWFVGVLQADVFKVLGSFSLMLYLSHTSMSCVVKWIAPHVFGWPVAELHDDIMLFWIYVLSYLLHLAFVRAMTFKREVPTQEETEPIIVETVLESGLEDTPE
jgi:peptidoglycan/LPS O-acetylase OafA/YrhL